MWGRRVEIGRDGREDVEGEIAVFLTEVLNVGWEALLRWAGEDALLTQASGRRWGVLLLNFKGSGLVLLYLF